MKHCFEVDVAADAGINAAIVFEYISFWISQNKRHGRNVKDGRVWMYSTQAEIAAQFGYLSVKQVRTAIARLIEGGYLIAGNYNKHAYDRTAWYALGENGEAYGRNGRHVAPVVALPNAQEGAPIPDNKTDNKPDIESRAAALRARIAES